MLFRIFLLISKTFKNNFVIVDDVVVTVSFETPLLNTLNKKLSTFNIQLSTNFPYLYALKNIFYVKTIDFCNQ